MEGRFTREKLDHVLRATCARLGLDASAATLLRFTNNAVYALARDPVVIRIVGSRALRHRANKVVTVARYFAACGVPAIRLFGQVRQPLFVGEHVVTVWERVADTGRRATSAELAALLSQVHALDPPDGVGGWAPLVDVRARVEDAEELAEHDRRFLLRRCAEVERELVDLEFPLPPGLVHGDAHPGNVIVGPGGPVLCDFDSACAGPVEWDLTPLAVGMERFGDPSGWYRELARGYGFDVTAWDGFESLRRARELKLTTSVLPIMRSHPSVRHELHRRLDDLRAGRNHTRWVRYR
ncbi:aminoglycoside phosphotransferase [Prauserella marina]|uniref:Predicted kinase, aminoglycoside phosphotransferase (APT) family n=1 Tax=Prauserella marina TaxID=530584 RepID=A0A222VIN6_9PSEU|nr:aminoglycoside phosphotransferase family protein [Prauserella marina]ASR33692.1 aminoglycoside phosphotransferase [Prauserella marina]PWV82246.1 aminoglycoside phosphotransferase (APT) family kinase protein [Prauserella marina]SDC64223.1 Predicted kinase, aminoglycoside phosphotransferase (APT) family [Prauserella marina]